MKARKLILSLIRVTPLLKKLEMPIRNKFRINSRRKFAYSYFNKKIKQIAVWSKLKNESTNFYYNLTSNNQGDLISLISLICDEDFELVAKHIKEIDENTKLKNHISNSWKNDPLMKDGVVAFGRRVGWYTLIRLLKPRIVIETGIHQGVGACVITSALKLNSEEGFPGKYFGTDIDLSAGQLFIDEYAKFGKILFGDSIESLKLLNEEIDIFINDSDHSAEYEFKEYLTIFPKLNPDSLILGDNSHSTDSLRKFSQESRRKFIFFKEEPSNHWYPGAGIGISINSLPLIKFQ
jgi:hypothetical protein